MAYIILCLQALSTSFEKIIQKKYDNRTRMHENSISVYLLITSITAIVFFFVLSGGRVAANGRTLIYSLLLAFCAFTSIFANILAIRHTDIVNTSFFSSAGSIIVPVLYSFVIFNEKLNVYKIASIILLCAVVIIPFISATKFRKTSMKGYMYCIVLFVEAGCVTILNKYFSMDAAVSSSNAYCFWANVFMIPVIIFRLQQGCGIKNVLGEVKKIGVVSGLIAVFSIILSNAGMLLSIYTLGKIGVSVYTIMLSSLNLIFLSLLSMIFYKQKITAVTAICMIMSIAAVILNTL